MVLVPQSTLQSLQSTAPTTSDRLVSDLDKNIQMVLQRDDIDVHDKAVLYSQYLQNYLKAAEPGKRPLSIEIRDTKADLPDTLPLFSSKTNDVPEAPPDPMEVEILQHVPKSFTKRASQIVQKLKANPDVSWTSTGQLKIRDKVVRGSNICDLVYDMFRERRNYTPTGSEQFIQILSDMNVPETFLSNPRRRHDLHRWKKGQDDEDPPTSSKLQETSKQRLGSSTRKRRAEPSHTAWVNF